MNSNDTSAPNKTRILRKQINAAIAFGSAVTVSCLVMMWSVFNAWTNVLTFWVNQQPGQAWWITAIMVLITCVVPFGLGLWLLIATLAKYKP